MLPVGKSVGGRASVSRITWENFPKDPTLNSFAQRCANSDSTNLSDLAIDNYRRGIELLKRGKLLPITLNDKNPTTTYNLECGSMFIGFKSLHLTRPDLAQELISASALFLNLKSTPEVSLRLLAKGVDCLLQKKTLDKSSLAFIDSSALRFTKAAENKFYIRNIDIMTTSLRNLGHHASYPETERLLYSFDPHIKEMKHSSNPSLIVVGFKALGPHARSRASESLFSSLIPPLKNFLQKQKIHSQNLVVIFRSTLTHASEADAKEAFQLIAQEIKKLPAIPAKSLGELMETIALMSPRRDDVFSECIPHVLKDSHDRNLTDIKHMLDAISNYPHLDLSLQAIKSLKPSITSILTSPSNARSQDEFTLALDRAYPLHLLKKSIEQPVSLEYLSEMKEICFSLMLENKIDSTIYDNIKNDLNGETIDHEMLRLMKMSFKPSDESLDLTKVPLGISSDFVKLFLLDQKSSRARIIFPDPTKNLRPHTYLSARYVALIKDAAEKNGWSVEQQENSSFELARTLPTEAALTTADSWNKFLQAPDEYQRAMIEIIRLGGPKHIAELEPSLEKLDPDFWRLQAWALGMEPTPESSRASSPAPDGASP